MVLETRFASDAPRPEHLYTIQVLNALGGSHCISSFYGVVIDSASRRLKGYLTEWTDEQDPLEHIIQNPDISWNQREQWARQLLIAVQAIHSKGWVVGNSNKESVANSRTPHEVLCSYGPSEGHSRWVIPGARITLQNTVT